MRFRLGHILLALVTCALPDKVLAQDVDVGISGLALVSSQPADDSYVGGPYLKEGIVNGAPVIDDDVSDSGSGFPVVLTGGVDVLQTISPRVSFVFGARYALIERVEQEKYLGIGSSVLRVGGGLRIRLH